MKDINYIALQKSKEAIDDIVNNWGQFSVDELKLFFDKFQSITHKILVDEANNRPVENTTVSEN